MSRLKCSICEREFDPADSAALPFCSHRCQQIDLGRWFGERYSVPVERLDDEDSSDSVDMSADSD